jgi:hypothetical protein
MERKGYAVLECSAQRAAGVFRAVETVNAETSAVVDLRRFKVDLGQAEVETL